ncbi:MAG TPA: hypothetical protein VK211_29725 [Kamptonema sp.]|nr:hypothetical protein [Kamptonema sp.]
MKALSILDEVVSILETDVNAQRITRLILFACKEIWENDPTVLERTNLREIIRNLCLKYSQVEDIEVVLNSIVSKVNKKTEYALIANTIITQISRLYEEEEETEVETIISNSFALQVPTYFVEPLNSSQPAEPEAEKLNSLGYLFDVRQKILQQTNPLRAKIIIFSTLYHEFTYSDRDWSLLKTQELDQLLRQLFNTCPTLTELESQLYKTASNLDNSDENAQAASVIIQAMTPCYIQEQQQQIQIQTESINDRGYEDTHLINSVYQENTLTNDVGYFEDGEITMMGQAAANNFYYNPQGNQPWPTHTIFSPGDETETSDPDATSELSPPRMQTYHVPEPVETAESSYQSPTPVINITDSIKQKLEREEEIKALVSESSNGVMTTVERTLSDLEVALNRQVSIENPEEHLAQKYKALRDFIGNIEEFTSKLIQILSELESAERQRLNPQMATTNANSTEEPQSPTHGKINQHRLVELARQGNPKAIAVFLNQFLQPKGINAMALLREGCFHIVLDSAEVPNQEVTATFVENKLASLKSKSITYVKVHGRISGNKSVAWTQEILNQSN